MSDLRDMVHEMADKIVILERQLAEQTRRAIVAEAWQSRLTTLLALSGKCPDPELCNDIGACERNFWRGSRDAVSSPGESS